MTRWSPLFVKMGAAGAVLSLALFSIFPAVADPAGVSTPDGPNSLASVLPQTVGAASLDAPDRLTATVVSPERIDLSWSYLSTNNEDGFQVFRSTAASGPWYQIGGTDANTTRFTADGLGGATIYYFIVRSYNAEGTSPFSNMVSATTPGDAGGPPSAPSNVAAQALSPTSINLTWTDTSAAEEGCQIFRAGNISGPWLQVAIADPGRTSYLDTGLASATTYFYSIRAYSAGGVSGFTPIVSATTSSLSIPPKAPSNLQASAVSSSQINLTWTDLSSDELGFRIERSTSSTGPWTPVSIMGPGVTGYSDTGLLAGSTFWYRVKAYSAAGDSAPSNVDSATTPSTPLPDAAPSNLVATAISPTRILLTWTDNSSNETGFAVEGYTQAGWVLLATVTGTSYTDDGLTPSSTYYYRVRAVNAAGSSAYSIIALATTPAADVPPEAPSGLTAHAASSTEIDLAWTDNSTNETRFKVERASAAGGPFVQIASIPGTSYADTGLMASTVYFYRVRASNATTYSPYTSVISAATLPAQTAPDAPAGLSASGVSATQIALTWTDRSDDETGFLIERASTAAGPFGQVAVTGANATGYTDTVAASSTFVYRVAAYNATGVSAYSNTASGTTRPSVPDAPSNLSTSVSGTQVTLSWTDGSDDESGFRIERAGAAGGPYVQVGVTAANATRATDTIPASTTVYYRVAAFNGAGSSTFSNVASATSRATLPSAPSNLSATALSSTTVGLSWSSTSTNEDGFRIERALSSSGPFSQIAIAAAASTTYSDLGGAPGTTYFYRVAAFNTAGTSAYSNVATATTRAVVPAAPSGLAAAAVSSSQINLTWIDGSTNETSFKIERATAASGPFNLIATRGAGSVSYSDAGLTASTAYYYRVRASNASGDSPYSNIATATTSGSSTDTQDPTVPQDLKVVAPGCGQISLTWTAATDSGSGLRGYNIYRKNTLLKQVPGSTHSASDLGLASATYFYYSVSAVDNAGNESAKSDLAGTYTQACVGSGGDYVWMKSFGGADVHDTGYAVAVDAAGNVFVAGEFQSDASFGGSVLSSFGYRDIFVAKYSASGAHLWSKSFGGPYDDSAKGIAVDAHGDVYVTGVFLQSAHFGSRTLASAGGYDIFMMKLSGSSGSLVWSNAIGGPGDDRAEAIAVDSRANVLITGQFKGVVDFGGGSVPNSSPYAQAYLAKYSGVDGAYLWSQRFGELDNPANPTFGSGQSVAIDASDNIVITGYFKGAADFGGGPIDYAGGLDVFVAKYSTSGAHLWSKGFGDPSDQHAQAVAVDGSGNVYITGDFLDTIDFGGGTLTSTPHAETVFLASFAPNGALRWQHGFPAGGLTAGSFAYGLATDASNNVIITGSLAGSVNFGGGVIPPAGPIYVAKFTQAGAPLWSKSFYGNGGKGRALATADDGSIYLTGGFEDKVDFGAGDTGVQGISLTDAFVVKLTP